MGAAEHGLALVELVQLFFERANQDHLAQQLFSLAGSEHFTS
jgi:hypothetical protein